MALMQILVAVASMMVCLSLGAPSFDDSEPFGKLAASATKVLDSSIDADIARKMKPTYGAKLPCKVVQSPSVPASVHRLRPSDIKVVGGMGDSITAAFGARSESLLTIATEYRDVSWSAGGLGTVDQCATLPNALKHFNPDVFGYATGIGNRLSGTAHLDVAVTSAVAEDMPAQAREIISRMKADPKIDFESDWKVITLWIGGNDLCRSCLGQSKHHIENYVGFIREALDILHEKVPRLFVNLVTIIDVTKLHVVRTKVCNVLHAFSCPCGTVLPEVVRNTTSALARDYQEAVLKLVASGRYDTHDNFTVVAQRFLEQVKVPYKDGEVDRSFFALDCFHFSTRSHAAAAVALWNSMLAPIGEKPLTWYLGEHMNCPTEERPFFATAKNSGPDAHDKATYPGLQKRGRTEKSNPDRESVLREVRRLIRVKLSKVRVSQRRASELARERRVKSQLVAKLARVRSAGSHHAGLSRMKPALVL